MMTTRARNNTAINGNDFSFGDCLFTFWGAQVGWYDDVLKLLKQADHFTTIYYKSAR